METRWGLVLGLARISSAAAAAFLIALLPSVSHASQPAGMYDPARTLEAFQQIGDARQVEGKNIAGTITADDGAVLPYTATLMLCENNRGRANILLRHTWEAPSRRAVHCIIGAWEAPITRFAAQPSFAFSAVRFMKDVTGVEGSSSPSASAIAEAWKKELRAFHALTLSGKCD